MSICPIIDGAVPTRQNGKTLPCASLAVENERLRELVDYMTPIAWYAASENERDRMYELGIEVDA